MGHKISRRQWIWTNVPVSRPEESLTRNDAERSLAVFTELLLQIQELPCRSEWTLRAEHFDWVQEKYGPFDVDACARDDGQNALLPEFWCPSRAMENQDGKNLRIYMNPPYDDIPTFVKAAVSKEATSLTMILPEWTREPWYRWVQPHVVHKWPAGSRVFTGPPNYSKVVRGSPWPVIVVHMSAEACRLCEDGM